MKKLIYALAISSLTLIGSSCGNHTDKPGSTSQANVATADGGFSFSVPFQRLRSDDKVLLDSLDFSEANYKLVKDQLVILSACAGDCSDDYCNRPFCLDRIMKCHSVDSAKFDSLTVGRKNDHATFSAASISGLLTGLTCGVNFVEVASDIDSIRVNLVSAVNGTATEKAYYSAALLKKICEKRTIDSIVVYRGIKHSGKILMPFIVFPRGSKHELYDVSNDYP